MRYLRMFSNALIAGALTAIYVALVFLQLNPSVPLDIGALVPLLIVIVAVYGSVAAAGFFVLILVRPLVVGERLSPGWVSLRLLVWLSTLAASAGALLAWLNLRGFGPVLEPEAARRMAAGAASLTLAAIALLILAVLHYSYGRKGSRFSSSVFVATVSASLVLPLVFRGAGGTPPPPTARVLPMTSAADESSRIIVLTFDGASLDIILPAAAEGRLPNLGKLLDRGALMHLATIRPTQPEPVWTSVATGKYPFKTGIRAASRHPLGSSGAAIELLPDYCFARALVGLRLFGEELNTSASLRAQPVWEILSRSGVTVGVVAWPLTFPAEAVRGFLVSDRGLSPDDEENPVFPPDVLPLVRSIATAPSPGSLPPAATALDLDDDKVPLSAAVTGPAERDRFFRTIAATLDARFRPRFVAVRHQALDTVGHRFLRFGMREPVGNVSEADRRRFGGVLERYYAAVDAEIGAAMASLGPGDVLFVMSAFGMEPVSLGKRLLGRLTGDADVSGTHEHAPGGFLLAYGSPVAPGRYPLGSIVDFAPTVLYLLGVPVGRDMDGYARTDLFSRAFTDERPIAFIPTHEGH